MPDASLSHSETSLIATTVNFSLVDRPDPDDPYSDRLGVREMPLPQEGQVVGLGDTSYRVVVVETHRLELLHDPWVTLLHIAKVVPHA